MWKLVIEDDEGKRTVIPLTRSEYTFGRREGNVIRLTERNVSREHARLCRKTDASGAEGTFILEDLTSYNGVFVNGLRITHAQSLAHGDLIQIGDYRIVLQDETVNAASEITGVGESKQTVPSAPHARAATLLDRPNRLVMLAGPTPGAEFPLDRDRMTLGRAEDSNISVNHNSVSRLHCEVHALGDGRFEIVDKGSSNGVRVNAAELRRGIIEPGDVIELGDVRFKFVGAGQIFLPTENQQLSAIRDRDAAAMARGRRASNALPLAVFAVVVCAGAAGAWAYTRPHLWTGRAAPLTAAPSPEQVALDDAKKLCAHGDCDAAHAKLRASIADSSRWRDTADFKDIETQWADGVLAKANAAPDTATKRALYQTVSQTTTVDPMRRKIAADRLQQLDGDVSAISANATELPTAAAASAKLRDESSGRADRRAALGQEQSMPPGSTPATATQSNQEAKIQLKQQLEPRVYGGRASDAEVRLLITTCRELGDKSCVQQARMILNSPSRTP